MPSKYQLFFEKNWLVLPIISGFLLVFSLPPFNLWFLVFVALVPIFYFINFSQKISLRKIFWGGFIMSAFFSFFLSSFTLFQFHWLDETYLFVWLIKLLAIIIAIISGAISGLLFVFYKKIISNKIIDVFILSAVSILIEIILYKTFVGFNNGSLAYAAHQLTPLLKISSVAGIFGVSFVINLINAFIVFFILRPEQRNKIIIAASLSFIIFFLINIANGYYLNGDDEEYYSAKFAIIQNSERKNVFGSFKNGEFSLAKEGLIAEARSFNPDFIVYPFSPFNGYLATDFKKMENEGLKKAVVMEDSDFGKWVAKKVGLGMVFINWVNTVRKDNVYPEIIFWQGQNQLANYQKRELFPFMDYTPETFKKMSFFTTPVDASKPFSNNLPVEIKNIKFSPLICSELFKPEIARRDSFLSNVFISIGSEAMFADRIPGEWNLILSQFRAAQNNRPLVRANILGSSALINEKGEIIKKMDFGQTGVLIADLKYKKSPKNTLYSYLGDWPFISIISLFLLSNTLLKLLESRLKKLGEN